MNTDIKVFMTSNGIIYMIRTIGNTKRIFIRSDNGHWKDNDSLPYLAKNDDIDIVNFIERRNGICSAIISALDKNGKQYQQKVMILAELPNGTVIIKNPTNNSQINNLQIKVISKFDIQEIKIQNRYSNLGAEIDLLNAFDKELKSQHFFLASQEQIECAKYSVANAIELTKTLKSSQTSTNGYKPINNYTSPCSSYSPLKRSRPF